MKKLMIAVAAAALVGGVKADFAYDFTASVKTTKAKQANTTIKVEYAQDATGTWWYEDSVFTQSTDKSGNPIANTFDYTSSSGNVYEKALKINAKTGVGTLTLKDNDGKAELDLDLAAYTEPEYRNGKKYWCLTYTYTVSGCVRVAGSRKLAEQYTISDCCGDTDFTSVNGDLPDITKSLLYRFGAADDAKATKLEFAGWMGSAAFDDATIAQRASSSSAIVLHLAGQGKWATLKAADKTTAEGISSISGNIVGVLPNDECNICCGAKDWDLVFVCDGTDNSFDAAYAEGWETAAFGTFKIKFNAKKSSL